MKIFVGKVSKGNIIIISILSLILIISIAIFYPRRISNLIKVDEIVEVNLIDSIRDRNPIKIDSNEFEMVIKKVRYRRRLIKIKAANTKYYEIVYKDGTMEVLGNYIFYRYDKNGNKTLAMQYILYGDMFSHIS